jgi:hypothetical protein
MGIFCAVTRVGWCEVRVKHMTAEPFLEKRKMSRTRATWRIGSSNKDKE